MNATFHIAAAIVLCVLVYLMIRYRTQHQTVLRLLQEWVLTHQSTKNIHLEKSSPMNPTMSPRRIHIQSPLGFLKDFSNAMEIPFFLEERAKNPVYAPKKADPNATISTPSPEPMPKKRQIKQTTYSNTIKAPQKICIFPWIDLHLRFGIKKIEIEPQTQDQLVIKVSLWRDDFKLEEGEILRHLDSSLGLPIRVNLIQFQRKG